MTATKAKERRPVDVLGEAVKAAGSQSAFAEQIGAQQQQVSAWLAENAIPSTLWRLKLHRLLGIDPLAWPEKKPERKRARTGTHG